MGFRRRLRDHVRPWVIVVPAAGCAHAANQDDHTGLDGWYAGAPAIALVDGEGEDRDRVSYRDGDRVDWRVVELPPEQRGALEVNVAWRPEHGDDQLAVILYDTDLRVLARARGRRGKAPLEVAAEDVSTRVYVQIYAPRRRDGATYQLSASFTPAPPPAPMVAAIAPDPPRLPAVPTFDIRDVCGPRFDARNVSCNPPPTPRGCVAGPDGPICYPDVCSLDPRADPRCIEPCTGVGRPDGPTCNPPPPRRASIVNVEASAGGTIITMNRGSNDAVDDGWRGRLLDEHGNSLPGGDFVVVRVTKSLSIAKVRLTPDQLKHVQVELRPP